jgi:hypothetical protein
LRSAYAPLTNFSPRAERRVTATLTATPS